MEQVFTNLVNNALDALDYEGIIQIRIEDIDENRIMWSIEDSGMGMDKHIQNLIFSPFFTTKSADKGTGLGLYWVKEIIKYHGGKVSVFSEGKDKGSTFRIDLPIYQTSKKRYINRLLKISKSIENQKDSNIS